MRTLTVKISKEEYQKLLCEMEPHERIASEEFLDAGYENLLLHSDYPACEIVLVCDK
jgi:hypothetical protein